MNWMTQSLALLQHTPSPILFPCPCSHLVAGRAQGVLWVAGTGLAALPTAQVPEVGAAAVTALSLHVGQAVALPTVQIAMALLGTAGAGVSAQRVAGAT